MNDILLHHLKASEILGKCNLSEQEIEDLAVFLRKNCLSKEMEHLVRMVEDVISISPSLEWKEIIEAAAEKIVHFLKAVAASIRIFNPETGKLVAFGSFQYAEKKRQNRIPLEKSVAGKVIKSGKSFLVPNILLEPDYENKDIAPPAFVGFPVDEVSGETSACEAMDAAIASAGGLDLAVLGLGANGHVGMNEPGTPIDAPTRPVHLAPSTVEAARGYGAEPPPLRGVTLGIGTLLRARELWLLARGAHKAAILAQALEGPVTERCPASLLRHHPRLRVVADERAATQLRRLRAI